MPKHRGVLVFQGFHDVSAICTLSWGKDIDKVSVICYIVIGLVYTNCCCGESRFYYQKLLACANRLLYFENRMVAFMMINKRLIGTVKESKKYIAGNVICQWVSLVANITMMGAVAKTLREMIYRKLLRLGSSYKEQTNTSEVVQVAVEGVDQLETCFGAYLPQFFYAMLAPLTLFGVLSFVNFPSAIVLLICVPVPNQFLKIAPLNAMNCVLLMNVTVKFSTV